jgi:hypothetical protein
MTVDVGEPLVGVAVGVDEGMRVRVGVGVRVTRIRDSSEGQSPGTKIGMPATVGVGGGVAVSAGAVDVGVGDAPRVTGTGGTEVPGAEIVRSSATNLPSAVDRTVPLTHAPTTAKP